MVLFFGLIVEEKYGDVVPACAVMKRNIFIMSYFNHGNADKDNFYFLCFISYALRFIPWHSIIAAPLVDTDGPHSRAD